MLTVSQRKEIREKAVACFHEAGIALSSRELLKEIEIVDYDYPDYYKLGIVIVTTVNGPRYCGRYVLFFPGQSCAEHWHPNIGLRRGKEETFRVLWGIVYAYIPGAPTESPHGKIPEGQEPYHKSRHELVLNPGDQYSLKLHERHWFQAGPKGAIAYEVSSHAFDKHDLTANKTFKVRSYKD